MSVYIYYLYTYTIWHIWHILIYVCGWHDVGIGKGYRQHRMQDLRRGIRNNQKSNAVEFMRAPHERS